MQPQQRLTAIILAAGSSSRMSRMGKPKQLLMLNGLCMLDHAIQAAIEAGIAKPIVVLGAHAKEIERCSTLLNHCTIIYNHEHHLGQSTSLQSGVRAAYPQSTAYLFLLADQPLVNSTLLTLLIQTFTQTKADIVYPEYDGQRGNPVIISASLRERLLTTSGDTGARFLFSDDSLKIISVPVPTKAVITDIDTPEEYQKVLRKNY
ncbi:NTP transferase domain-containing protein [Desulforhopalus sp. IMCC35007]|uniref:nucleotidyltransferase family protein n=1 Tax=Desulforhopalus sp. IMCC35007 TaxID=2569543 RepID=UPI0010AE1702|nr:nucleotidyltransferase family protein [Desulforhopalus sp. IMCC35007]TKB10708.1 nucleotidyltransferase family protein [Desulforhopalus sp. IMCC35007]